MNQLDAKSMVVGIARLCHPSPRGGNRIGARCLRVGARTWRNGAGPDGVQGD